MTLSHFPRMPRASQVSAMLLCLCMVPTLAQSAPHSGSAAESAGSTAEKAPVYKVDAAWPRPLPNHWVLGVVCGVAVDRRNHVWIVHRPSSVPADKLQSGKAAPPVLEFAADGTLLSSWGGPWSGPNSAPGPAYDWPQEEHGIFVDAHDNVWLAGAGEKDAQILKFTNKGKFLLQIGHQGQSRGSNDTANLGGAANMVVDEAANELYVADGYINHRVIVFDATTGAYKRQWGAYGKRPDDSYYTKLGIKPGQHPTNFSKGVPGPPSPQFDLVHGVQISKDGLVYVCDRTNNRIQVFHKDGTFVQEAFIANDVLASGTVSDIGFSPDPGQRFAFVADSTNQQVFILNRRSLKVIGKFGGPGHLPGQFQVAHNMAVDSKGDIFVAESQGARVQKFVPVGDNKNSSEKKRLLAPRPLFHDDAEIVQLADHGFHVAAELGAVFRGGQRRLGNRDHAAITPCAGRDSDDGLVQVGEAQFQLLPPRGFKPQQRALAHGAGICVWLEDAQCNHVHAHGEKWIGPCRRLVHIDVHALGRQRDQR